MFEINNKQPFCAWSLKIVSVQARLFLSFQLCFFLYFFIAPRWDAVSIKHDFNVIFDASQPNGGYKSPEPLLPHGLRVVKSEENKHWLIHRKGSGQKEVPTLTFPSGEREVECGRLFCPLSFPVHWLRDLAHSRSMVALDTFNDNM